MQRTWPRGLTAELHQRRDGYPALRRAAERVGLVRIGGPQAISGDGKTRISGSPYRNEAQQGHRIEANSSHISASLPPKIRESAYRGGKRSDSAFV